MRLILLLMIIPAVAALDVTMTVSEFLDAQIIGLENKQMTDVVNTSFEVFNSGSIGSKSRVRIDVLNQGKPVARLWSNEFVFQPNDREFIEFYWPLQNRTGKFTISVKYYGSNEIKDLGNYSFQVKNQSNFNETIQIISPKIYKDKITFHVKPEKTTEAYVIPLRYPNGWIIEQTKSKIYQGKMNYIEVNMKPDVWNKGTIVLMVADGNGNYGTSEFQIKRESFLNEAVFSAINFLEGIFSKFL
ncbi:MAG: hypothetical protein QXF12_07015 [Candidatus Aenigmatarchaeota archaeon]